MSRSTVTIFRPLVDTNISETSKKLAQSHCVRNRRVILQTQQRRNLLLLQFRNHTLRQHKVQKQLLLRTTSHADRTLAFALRPSRVNVGNAYQPGNSSSKMARYFRLGFRVGSLGSSVFLCAFSQLSWSYYHPVVVGTRTEKRSIQ
jgi:hypothetical protein